MSESKCLLLLPAWTCSCEREFPATLHLTEEKEWKTLFTNYLSARSEIQLLRCPHNDDDLSALGFRSAKESHSFSFSDALKQVQVLRLSQMEEAERNTVLHITKHLANGSSASEMIQLLDRWCTVTKNGTKLDFTSDLSEGYEFKCFDVKKSVANVETSSDVKLYKWWQQSGSAPLARVKLHQQQSAILRTLAIHSIALGWANKWGDFLILHRDLETLEDALKRYGWPLHDKKPAQSLPTIPEAPENENFHQVAEGGCLSFNFE